MTSGSLARRLTDWGRSLKPPHRAALSRRRARLRSWPVQPIWLVRYGRVGTLSQCPSCHYFVDDNWQSRGRCVYCTPRSVLQLIRDS